MADNATNTDSMERLRVVITAKTVNKRKDGGKVVVRKAAIAPVSTASLALQAQLALYAQYATISAVKATADVLVPKKDDGKGAQRILFSCVDQVLKRKKNVYRIISPDDTEIINTAQNILKKIEHSHMENVPLISAKNAPKYHTNKKRKKIIHLCDRMRSSDPNLVRITLGCDDIDDELVKQIATALKKSSYTKKLFLTRNFITDEGVKYLGEALKLTNLELLSLGGNLITDIGAGILAESCLESMSIKHLNLANKWPLHVFKPDSSTIYHPHITFIGAEHFARAMVDKSFTLVSLCLSDQRIGKQCNSSLLYVSDAFLPMILCL